MLATSEFCALILLPLLRSVPALLPLSDGLHTNVAVDASGAARVRIARRPSAELTSRGGGAVAAELLRLVASLHELLRPPADGGAAAADGVTWALGDEEAPPLVRNARLVVGPRSRARWSLRCPGAASFALAFAPDGDDAAAPAGVLRLRNAHARRRRRRRRRRAPPPADALGAGLAPAAHRERRPLPRVRRAARRLPRRPVARPQVLGVPAVDGARDAALGHPPAGGALLLARALRLDPRQRRRRVVLRRPREPHAVGGAAALAALAPLDGGEVKVAWGRRPPRGRPARRRAFAGAA